MNDLDLELVVAGRRLRGWRTVSLRRSLEEFCDSFSLEYVDRWLPEGASMLVRPGQRCQLYVAGKRLLDGYVDQSEVSYSRGEHALSASGRSVVCDLVDCSAMRQGGPWIKRSVLDIAADLCSPFGILILDATNGGLGDPIDRFALEVGETVFEAISRLAKMRGVLPIAVEDALAFVRSTGTDRTQTVLRYGSNLLSGRRESDFRDRFSEYVFLAQTSNVGDVYSEDRGTTWTRRITDDGVGRYRPSRLVCEVAAAKGDMVKRGVWERNTRRGRSERLAYTVQGWLTAEGTPWAHNTRVVVDDPALDAYGEWLIVSATLTRDESGSRTELELLAPEAYDVEVATPTKRARGKRKKAAAPRPVVPYGPPAPPPVPVYGPPAPPPVPTYGPPLPTSMQEHGPPPPPIGGAT